VEAQSHSPEARPRAGTVAGPPGRAPLVQRKRAARRAARRRIAARTLTDLAPGQRDHDPLDHRRPPARALAYTLLALAGSWGVHAAAVGVGALVARFQDARGARPSSEVTIEMRERKPPPPPEEKKEEEKKPEPAAVERRPIRPPKVAKAPEPPPPEPKQKVAPRRIVGLSLESTVEGGGGPTFAVGNTKRGETAARAEDPREVPPARPPVEAPPAAGSGEGNQPASRIPVAGVKFQMPKRKRNRPPPYPETLKSQGIEADVTVMVTVDASGKVTSVRIIKESPYPEFNQAARAAAEMEEFEPALRDGVSIPHTLSYTYRFRLEDS